MPEALINQAEATAEEESSKVRAVHEPGFHVYFCDKLPDTDLRQGSKLVSALWVTGSYWTTWNPGAFENGDNTSRSEERRVGKECRSRWSPYH